MTDSTLRQQRNELSQRAAGRVARLGGWSVTAGDHVVSWSNETAAIHDEPAGFSPSASAALAYYPKESRGPIEQSLAACEVDGTPFELEAQLVTAKGRKIWVRTIGEAVRNAAGEITHVQGAFQDITAQKTSADHIRNLAGRIHDTLENISDAFFTLDRSWRFTYLNAAAERLLHRRRTELLERVIWDEFKQEAATAADRAYRRVMDEGVTVNFEQFYAPLGKWFEVQAYPSREGLAVYFRDISDRKRDEKQLREQATLLDKASDAIVVRDLDHKILYWNRSAERIYGWAASEALGQSIQGMLYADSAAAFLAAMKLAVEDGEWIGEIEQTTKDKRTLNVEGHWTLVRDDEGKPTSILAINTDVTQRKKLEGQFLRAQRLESIGELAGGIAHDLNNTLAPILMTVSVMREEEKDPERREDLATIETCAQRGADMVRQLLSFARGSDEGRRTRTDLGKIAADIQKIAKDTFPKHITFRLTVARDAWPVNADATQLHQVLMNLCVNARDAMPAGGVLGVAVERAVLDDVYAGMNFEARPGPYVLLRVDDSGTGMDPALIDRIFDPFFTTKEAGKGTGLGLSTAHSIVRSHGGFIHVYSELGKGTRFRVYFPALITEGTADDAPVEHLALPRGAGQLILVVDDEEAIRKVAQRTLERFGYRALLATNGAEAISRYVEHRDEIAVVLTDMSMPVMDGPATIVALRTLDPDVRIIGSSGLDANGHLAKAVGAGVHHFVPKPYTAEALLRMLKRILSEPS